MNHANSPGSMPFNSKKIVVILLVLGAVAAYKYFVPGEVGKGTGDKVGLNENVVVPDKIDLKLDSGSSNTKSKLKLKQIEPKSSPYLSNGKNGSKVSPSGLVYTSSRSGEHRTAHVLRHAQDDPKRSGSHGVFDVENNDDVFRLIDEAYDEVKKKSSRVESSEKEDFKKIYVVNMKRTIGYKGGQSGKRSGHPKLKKIKLVLAENRVITAYPY